ncbi:MAG: 2-hydroxychromene-2-carboxylate isomerase [Labilithrix sp.]|nr:2-hydroxychromene-2-carboxylate isomerase [Labilithrix sp.]
MKPVDLYFDYASPWAYLANELLPRKLAGCAVTHHPIYLRGLETFAKGMPYTGGKLAYIARDLARCAEHEGVVLAPPATFPVDGLHALRAAHVALERSAFERYHGRMFRAVWAEQRDVGKKESVAAILADAIGTSETVALEAMGAQAIKDRLRVATARAEARGVFGAPTFFVGDEQFWGHDRFDYVARAAGAPSAPM